jgi:hypothetical protein
MIVLRINPDTQELRMCCDDWLYIVFAMTFCNMLIYCASRYEAKTSLVAICHHDFGTLWIASHEIGSQNAGSRGTAAITPPRFNTFRSSRCTRVPKYASANRHCRPPSMNTNVAPFKGATNSAEFAFSRSFVSITDTS